MAGAKGRSGRPATTSHREIAEVAVQLFHKQGYAATSVADIAAAVGIARRTFFSYFASKADAFWWRDEQDLLAVEQELAETPTDTAHPLQQMIDISMASTIRTQVDKEEVRSHVTMIESNPELQIGAMRFQRRWARVIADHLRRQTGGTKSDLLPEVISAALLSIANTVLVRWAYSNSEDTLEDVFNENIAVLRSAFEETVSDKILH